MVLHSECTLIFTLDRMVSLRNFMSYCISELSYWMLSELMCNIKWNRGRVHPWIPQKAFLTQYGNTWLAKLMFKRMMNQHVCICWKCWKSSIEHRFPTWHIYKEAGGLIPSFKHLLCLRPCARDQAITVQEQIRRMWRAQTWSKTDSNPDYTLLAGWPEAG